MIKTSLLMASYLLQPANNIETGVAVNEEVGCILSGRAVLAVTPDHSCYTGSVSGYGRVVTVQQQ